MYKLANLAEKVFLIEREKIMNDEEYLELAGRISAQVHEKIDFGTGTLCEISDEMYEQGYIFDVCWKMNVHFIVRINKWTGGCWYYAERNKEQVSASYYSRKYDDRFFQSVQHLVNEIANGDFNHKKTLRERIQDIICERQLASYMNDTKWREFIHAMDEEMSVRVPYDYKTLFEEPRQELLWGSWYDRESFNNYDFKSIEWVKVKPKFYISTYRGRLLDDEKELCNAQQEFLDLMKKYSIPYEYDEENDIYVIYGYKGN